MIITMLGQKEIQIMKWRVLKAELGLWLSKDKELVSYCLRKMQ